jgi:hypothetical protein
MKRIIITLIIAFTSLLIQAQNFNPFLAQGIVSPSPLSNVISNGIGQVSFLVGNSGDDAMPLVAGQEMLLVVTLSRGIPNNANPLLAVGGSFATYFTWQYDAVSKTYLGTQNATIPDALNGGVGDITIAYKVTSNSLETNPQNGFNVNLTPPAYSNGINTLGDDKVSSYTWTVLDFSANPDVNATFIDSLVTGSVSTNDNKPTGATYGTPVGSVSNPSGGVLVMQSNGTYTFKASNSGVYKYSVPVCPTGVVINCPIEQLTITVTAKQPDLNNPNAPTVNVDIATTIAQAPVTLKTLSNDACNNGPGCSLAPSSVVIIDQPNHGTALKDPLTGNITYTANPGYFGLDTLEYNVCDTSVTPAKCASSYQIITVKQAGGKNGIYLTDDYKITTKATQVSGNVLDNDGDPEGDELSVTPQNQNIAGKGIFVLNSDGTYTFTPDATFVGNVEFVYQACDNASPIQACASATLRITVSPILSPLPLTWLSFTVFESNCEVNLNWETSYEENVSHFDVMRQKEGESIFSKIGEIAAVGNSVTTNKYFYKDINSINSGTYYYQLKSVDIDSKYDLSKINPIVVNCGTKNEISVYPNIIENEIHIDLYNENVADYTIKLIDMSGRVLVETIKTVANKNETITLPVTHISQGLYQLLIATPEKIETFKLIKK